LVTNDSNFKLDQAINYFKKGEFHKALSIFEILKKNHNDFLLHWYLGHTYFKLHKYSAAIKSVKKSIQLKSKDTLNLSVNNTNSGDGKETLAVKFDHDLEISFNSRYLIDVASQIDGNKIDLYLNDTGSPALIRDPGDFDSIFVVMPMKG